MGRANRGFRSAGWRLGALLGVAAVILAGDPGPRGGGVLGGPPVALAQERVTALDSLRLLVLRAAQHLVVVTDGPGKVDGVLYRMERVLRGRSPPDTLWRHVGRPVPVVVGRSGIGPKREGDGRSPRGVFLLGRAFGAAPRPPSWLKLPYQAMKPGSVCVDDTASAFYNRIVDAASLPRRARPDWASAEPMRRDLTYRDDLYRWGVVVRYNDPPRAGVGSCIFLHVWRAPRSPTSGCTAMASADLLTLLRWLAPDDRPVLIQGTRSYLEGLHRSGVLPYALPGGAG